MIWERSGELHTSRGLQLATRWRLRQAAVRRWMLSRIPLLNLAPQAGAILPLSAAIEIRVRFFGERLD